MSRASLKNKGLDQGDEFEFVVHSVSKYLSISPEKRKTFIIETEKDPTLK